MQRPLARDRIFGGAGGSNVIHEGPPGVCREFRIISVTGATPQVVRISFSGGPPPGTQLPGAGSAVTSFEPKSVPAPPTREVGHAPMGGACPSRIGIIGALRDNAFDSGLPLLLSALRFQ